jgi:hypothetical protein
MLKQPKKIMSVCLTVDQFNFIEDYKWNNKVSKSRILRVMIEDFKKDSNNIKKLKKLLEEDLKDEK